MATDRKWQRLISARDDSFRRLDKFRVERRSAVRQFVGAHYGVEGSPKHVPLNYLELAISIYRRLLAPRIPKVLWTTQIPELRQTALTAELAENELLREMNFGRTLSRWTMDGLISIGLLKLGLEPVQPTDLSGQPFAETISLDDWVHDTGANRIEDAQFMGNRYWLPLEKAQDLFGDDSLMPSDGSSVSTGSHQETKDIGSGHESKDPATERWMDTIELWDMWLPYSKELVTFAGDEPDPLRVMKWKGPKRGPYHILSYAEVPDNIMPLAPVSNLIDLHMMANTLFRKLRNQAENIKNVIGYQDGHEQDALRLQASQDLDLIKMDDPNSLVPFKTGQLDAPMVAFSIQLRDMFSWFAGNLDILGGLSAQSETLGQDRLLASSASERLKEMQDRTLIAVNGVTEDIGEYLFSDNSRTKRLLHTIGEFEVELEFGPKTRKGDLSDYLIEVAPYSLQTRSPAERLQTIQTLFEKFILPLGPQMEQQGLAPDMRLLTDLVARYSDTPEIRDILVGVDPTTLPGGQHAREGRQSPVTTRRNIRINQPGSTRQGRDDALAKSFLGEGLRQGEAGSLSQPVTAPPA